MATRRNEQRKNKTSCDGGIELNKQQITLFKISISSFLVVFNIKIEQS
ncbi:MAG: hypothetical protein SPJ49_03495 [Bacilli bacterium]|nr:hypothetical protein [Bacilli bacterium]